VKLRRPAEGIMRGLHHAVLLLLSMACYLSAAALAQRDGS
jgi:hypothetical protein